MLCSDLGTYCPQGSALVSSCEPGYYSLVSGNRSTLASSCRPCAPGMWQNDSTKTSCEACETGYLCLGGSSSPTPLNASSGGYPCPPGNFCPPGAMSPIPCGLGFYQPNERAHRNDSCIPCPAGTYNNLVCWLGLLSLVWVFADRWSAAGPSCLLPLCFKCNFRAWCL